MRAPCVDVAPVQSQLSGGQMGAASPSTTRPQLAAHLGDIGLDDLGLQPAVVDAPAVRNVDGAWFVRVVDAPTGDDRTEGEGIDLVLERDLSGTCGDIGATVQAHTEAHQPGVEHVP
eukprot:scaffold83401_cov69-Phaeocystis_antarctica.AAC.3